MYYIPNVGAHVKFKEFCDYTIKDLPPWSWFKVTSSPLGENNSQLWLELLNGDQPTGKMLLADISSIQPPVGWQAEYTVVNERKDQLDKIYTWLFTRGGITIWACLDLSMAGRKMFAPGDKFMEKPHWAYGLVEVVTDPARMKFFWQEVVYTKPCAKPSLEGWTYDKHNKEWYRDIAYQPKRIDNGTPTL